MLTCPGRRQHLERFAAQAEAEDDGSSPSTGALERISASHDEQPARFGAWSRINDSPFERFLVYFPGTHERAIKFMQMAFPGYGLSLYRPSDLETLARLNVVNAIAINAAILGVRFEDMYIDECISPFNIQGPRTPDAANRIRNAPRQLRPTVLQTLVTHHPWIDVLPFPCMRDNIIRGLEAGLLDEDELCHDIARHEGSGDDTLAPVVVWGESWDARGWEISTAFLRKWSWLLQGCPEVFQSTNFWREKRGQPKYQFTTN
jgi:hypothetical protein